MRDASTSGRHSHGAHAHESQDAADRTSHSSGRAGVDERGNAVWEWRIATGVYSRDPDTLKLRRLESSELSIAETGCNEQLRGPSTDQGSRLPRGPHGERGVGPALAAADRNFGNHLESSAGGCNPYDSAGSLAGTERTMPQSGRTTVPPRRTPADLRKLDAWIRLKKALAGTKKA